MLPPRSRDHCLNQYASILNLLAHIYFWKTLGLLYVISTNGNIKVQSVAELNLQCHRQPFTVFWLSRILRWPCLLDTFCFSHSHKFLIAFKTSCCAKRLIVLKYPFASWFAHFWRVFSKCYSFILYELGDTTMLPLPASHLSRIILFARCTKTSHGLKMALPFNNFFYWWNFSYFCKTLFNIALWMKIFSSQSCWNSLITETKDLSVR